MLYNVVVVPTVQQSESAIHIPIFPLFWISFPFRSPQPAISPGCALTLYDDQTLAQQRYYSGVPFENVYLRRCGPAAEDLAI